MTWTTFNLSHFLLRAVQCSHAGSLSALDALCTSMSVSQSTPNPRTASPSSSVSSLTSAADEATQDPPVPVDSPVVLDELALITGLAEQPPDASVSGYAGQHSRMRTTREDRRHSRASVRDVCPALCAEACRWRLERFLFGGASDSASISAQSSPVPLLLVQTFSVAVDNSGGAET